AFVDVIQTLQIALGERELKLLLDRLADGGQVGRIRLFIGGGLTEKGDDLLYRRVRLRGLVLRQWPAQQAGEKLYPNRREVEDGFVHQVLDYRLAADVHDEGDARSNLGDVGEILFRPNSEISPAGSAELPQLVHHGQVGGLVGCEIVRAEVTVLFGKFTNQARKLRGRQ